MIRFVIRAALVAVLAGATSAAAADASCQIVFSMASTYNFSSLLISPLYTNALGELKGAGKLVECQPRNEFLLDFEDTDSSRVLTISMNSQAIQGPIDLAQCTWLPVGRFPVAADFDMSNQVGAVGVIPPIYFANPEAFIADIQCTGTIETTTTTIVTTTTTTTEEPTTSTTSPAPAVCGDYDGSSKVTIADALGVLRTSVGLVDCELCVCDADGNGSNSISDALRTLRLAVGQQVTMSCPECS